MTLNNLFRKKSLGILLHPSSLPGTSYCGTFGDITKDWLSKLSKYNINYWQFLPLTPPDSTGSPYSSPSSFALNPWFLDVNELIRKRFIISKNIEELNPKTENRDFFDFKMADSLSKKIGEHLLNSWQFQSEERQNKFLKWIKDNSWVENYSLFIVIREEFNMLPWWEWPKEFKEKKMETLKKWISNKNHEILKQKLIQWHLDEQWKEIRELAKLKGITLIGDLPFYVSRDSADVWSNKSLFSVTQNGSLLFQSGVPPDYFSSTGQLWGTPTYYWSKHKRSNFSWWRERFKRQFKLFDILRLDHFRALAGYWRVDGIDKTAINGKWINSPGRELLSSLKKDLETDNLPIIAEDLGVITSDVEILRDNYKLPGMKILQFAFDGNEKNPYLPKNIVGRNWIVYTGTHDNATSISWWESLDNNRKKYLQENYNFSNDPSWDLIKIGMQTDANLFITPIQDILGLNDSSRLNTPGTLDNNWKWKLNKPLDEIEINLKKYRDIGRIYGRI